MRNERNLTVYKLFAFDLKALAALNIIPPLVMAAMFIYCMEFMTPEPFFKGMIPAMEFVIPPFAAWWSIFLFQEILESQGCEIFFTYSVSRFMLGFCRALIWFIVYCLFLGAMLYCLQTYTEYEFFSKLYIQLVIQSFFFAALGYAAMMFFSNSTYSLFVVISYSSLFIFLKSLSSRIFMIFLRNEVPVSVGYIVERLRWPIVIAVVMWVIGQWRFIKYKDYK